MSDGTALEEAIEKVLIRYNVSTYLVYDGFGKIVADRGDLASSLADAARQHLLSTIPPSAF